MLRCARCNHRAHTPAAHAVPPRLRTSLQHAPLPPSRLTCSVGRVGRADTMGLAISLLSAVPEKASLGGWIQEGSEGRPRVDAVKWAAGTLPAACPAFPAPPVAVLLNYFVAVLLHQSPCRPCHPPTAHPFSPPHRRSQPPPQVWFCAVKSLKPWLQPDAQNTRTNEQGGQTIWYDEPQLLKVRGGLRCSGGGLVVAASLEGKQQAAGHPDK